MAEERELAQQTQEKFQFYAVGLAFTVLAASVQTASFAGPVMARVLELVAWASLLLAGLTGLSRIEWEPFLRVKMALKDEFEEKIARLQHEQRAGVRQVFVVQTQQNEPIEQSIHRNQGYVEKLSGLINKLDRKSKNKYSVFKVSLFFGLACLVGARAYAPVQDIVRELCN